MSDDPNTANGASQKNTEKKPEKRPDFSIQKTPEKELGENMGCAAFGLVLGIICLIAPVGQITMPSEKETPTLNKWGISGLILGAPITIFGMG